MSKLPLSRTQVLKGTRWLMGNFGDDIARAVAGKPYGAEILCAIACKETGFIWIARSDKMAADALLPLLIGDASGDVPGHGRRAFPRNTAAFRAAYGDAFADMLIAETNKARALRGLSPARILYKGFGIFQYDLQHVQTDREFFERRMWHRMAPCLERATRELDRTFRAAGGDPRDAVRRYNGAGTAAQIYAGHVMAFADIARPVVV